MICGHGLKKQVRGGGARRDGLATLDFEIKPKRQMPRLYRVELLYSDQLAPRCALGEFAVKTAGNCAGVRRCLALSVLLLACPGFVEAGVKHAAPKQCAVKTARGTGASAEVAKFQVYEGLLKSTGAIVWLSWITNGTTPGYSVRPVKYVCDKGSGLGVACRGKTTICKL